MYNKDIKIINLPQQIFEYEIHPQNTERDKVVKS